VGVIAGRLAAMQDEAEPWQRRLARDATDLLAAHPPLLSQATRLAVALITADDSAGDSVDDFIDDDLTDEGTGTGTDTGDDGRAAALGDGLCALADLLRDRPLLTARTAGRVASALMYEGRRRRSEPPATALPAARRLVDRGDLAGALFALGLARAGGERTEWAAPWREVVVRLRACPHLEVRQEAWDISLPLAQNI
ncbi:hypothetical protein JYK22_07800, partial [Nonomuraea sp. RK-328]|nr:hypothetical protein [Nonomuraea sp. RK-328]